MKKESKDILWKEIIEDLFEDFLEFFFPNLYSKVDLDRGYEFLDKELAKIIDKTLKGKKFSDRLVKIYFEDGTESWILIHIEVQGYEETGFSERMFKYFYRIYDKYDRKITALSIFTDDNQDYKPQEFNYQFHGTQLNYEYNIYKVLDQSEDELLASDNPFALVVLAGLYTLKSKGRADKLRYQFKTKLVRLLLERNYRRQKIYNIFEFLDGVLFLTDELEWKFKERVKELVGGDDKMGVSKEMTNLYQLGEKKGERKKEIEMIRRMLSKGMEVEEVIEISDLSRENIEKIADEIEH